MKIMKMVITIFQSTVLLASICITILHLLSFIFHLHPQHPWPSPPLPLPPHPLPPSSLSTDTPLYLKCDNYINAAMTQAPKLLIGLHPVRASVFCSSTRAVYHYQGHRLFLATSSSISAPGPFAAIGQFFSSNIILSIMENAELGIRKGMVGEGGAMKRWRVTRNPLQIQKKKKKLATLTKNSASHLQTLKLLRISLYQSQLEESSLS